MIEKMNAINSIAQDVFDTAKSKGWHENSPVKRDGTPDPDRIAAMIAMVHSELSEAIEELRTAATFDALTFVHFEQPSGKPVGFAVEMADAVIRIMDTCKQLGVDLGEAMEIKMDYNKKRPHRHGGKRL